MYIDSGSDLPGDLPLDRLDLGWGRRGGVEWGGGEWGEGKWGEEKWGEEKLEKGLGEIFVLDLDLDLHMKRPPVDAAPCRANSETSLLHWSAGVSYGQRTVKAIDWAELGGRQGPSVPQPGHVGPSLKTWAQ